MLQSPLLLHLFRRVDCVGKVDLLSRFSVLRIAAHCCTGPAVICLVSRFQPVS